MASRKDQNGSKLNYTPASIELSPEGDFKVTMLNVNGQEIDLTIPGRVITGPARPVYFQPIDPMDRIDSIESRGDSFVFYLGQPKSLRELVLPGRAVYGGSNALDRMLQMYDRSNSVSNSLGPMFSLDQLKRFCVFQPHLPFPGKSHNDRLAVYQAIAYAIYAPNNPPGQTVFQPVEVPDPAQGHLPFSR